MVVFLPQRHLGDSMKLGPALLAGAFLWAGPAIAQSQPQSAGGDLHLQQIDYDAGEIVRLRGSPGYQMMIALSPDEQVQTVSLGDSSAWQVSLNRGGDRLFLKPSQGDVVTNMTVVTSVRTYNFDLVSLAVPAPDMPYTVEFRYPALKSLTSDAGYVDVGAATRRISRYKVSGAKQLWPSGMTNDGQHTFISWPKTAAIPAVYAQDEHGKDVLVNGMMGRDDVYVVDGVPDRLTFRIDESVAYAARQQPRKPR
jgi:type IV secretion system protein VirB9